MTHDPTSIGAWLQQQRQRSELVLAQVPLHDCAGWRFDGDVWRHASGRFFSVVGLRCSHGPQHLVGLTRPMIDQPEVGILGFVVRRHAAGWQWLLQAKTEPGNVLGTQVGPSVQATLSNYMRVHGGKPTAMIERFTGAPAGCRRLTDVEQSEQGDRFLGKYNRNLVVEVAPDFVAPADAAWRWFDAVAVRAALAQDFSFNTDARSVLCCSDWSLLGASGGGPFQRWRTSGGFGRALLDSHRVPLPESGHAAALARLAAVRRQAGLRIERLPLRALPGWRVGDWAIEHEHGDVDPVVRAFRVHSADREVHDWCQPLLTNRQVGTTALVCAVRDGVLQFWLVPRVEPGFVEQAQYGPSLLTGPGHANDPVLQRALHAPGAQVRLAVRQSDEGGRFKDSVAHYRIVQLPAAEAAALHAGGAWATLSAVQAMTAERGLLSNELRSCVSLLLHWA